MVQPRTGQRSTKDILGLGIEPAFEPEDDRRQDVPTGLRAEEQAELAQLVPPDQLALNPGDTISRERRADATRDDFVSSTRPSRRRTAGRSADGPRAATARTRSATVPAAVHRASFGDKALNFGGMLPRVRVEQVLEGSPVRQGRKRPQARRRHRVDQHGNERPRPTDPTLDEFRRLINRPARRTRRRLGRRSATASRYDVRNLHTKRIDPHPQGLKIGSGYESDAGRSSAASGRRRRGRGQGAGRRPGSPKSDGQPAAQLVTTCTGHARLADDHTPGRPPTRLPVPVPYTRRTASARPRSCAVAAAEADSWPRLPLPHDAEPSTSPGPPSARRAARSTRSAGA